MDESIFETGSKQLNASLFTLKYKFQNHSDGTLTSNKANGFCFFPTLPAKLLFWKNVVLLNGMKFHKKGGLLETNARVWLCTVIKTHLTVEDFKVAKINKTTYSCFKRGSALKSINKLK